MNDKLKTDNKQKADIDLGDINELESELNNLTEDISIQKSSSLEKHKINDGPSVTSNSVKFEDLGSKDTGYPALARLWQRQRPPKAKTRSQTKRGMDLVNSTTYHWIQITAGSSQTKTHP